MSYLTEPEGEPPASNSKAKPAEQESNGSEPSANKPEPKPEPAQQEPESEGKTTGWLNHLLRPMSSFSIMKSIIIQL